MHRLIYGKVRPKVARVLGLCETDVRVAEYVNAAEERALYKGKWVGTYGRYRVCVRSGCLTWPWEIETIEAAAHCGTLTIRDPWYEFLESGPGVDGCGVSGLLDRGEAVAFDDVKGTGKKLAVYSDGAEMAGAKILLRYYDSNGNKVRTVDGASVIEGEYVTLPAAGNYAYTAFEVMPGGLYGVIKPVTKYVTRLYEYTVSGGALKPLAYYQPREELPVYRRSLIPGMAGCSCGDETIEGSCGAVEIVGKFRHIPVVDDNDYLIIGHTEALKLMAQAVQKEENNLWDEARKYEAQATRMLNEQLAHWRGSGVVSPLRFVGAETYGGGVPNLI